MRILHIMNGADNGGISKVVLNLLKVAEKQNIYFDCAMYSTLLGPNGKELERLGARFYKLPLKSKHPFQYIRALKNIFSKYPYDGIHVHYNETSFFPIAIAMNQGVKIRIAHAHTARVPDGFLAYLRTFFSKTLTALVATEMVACSEEAAEHIFGKKSLSKNNLMILKNCIETQKYSFDTILRGRIRDELSLNDTFVLGYVGNLGPEKNLNFAFEIFKEILKERKATFLIIGDGELKVELEGLVKNLHIDNWVIFLGQKTNVSDYLNAMDAFIMTSLYEGFAIAALEAAANGLPIYLSNKIPAVFNFYSKAEYLSLEKHPKFWAKKIINSHFDSNRLYGITEVLNNNFDISDLTEQVKEIYCL